MFFDSLLGRHVLELLLAPPGRDKKSVDSLRFRAILRARSLVLPEGASNREGWELLEEGTTAFRSDLATSVKELSCKGRDPIKKLLS